MTEKDLLNQIRKKFLTPLIGTSIVTVVVILSLIFAILRRPNQNLFEMIFIALLVVFIVGSAMFVELYQYLTPQKNIFFRKYGRPAEAILLVNDALSESSIYTNDKITITENYIYNPNDLSTLLRIDDVLVVFEQYTSDNKKEYACVGVVDCWGVQQLFKFKIDDVSTVRKTISVIRENFPDIKIGLNEKTAMFVHENTKKLAE